MRCSLYLLIFYLFFFFFTKKGCAGRVGLYHYCRNIFNKCGLLLALRNGLNFKVFKSAVARGGRRRWNYFLSRRRWKLVNPRGIAAARVSRKKMRISIRVLCFFDLRFAFVRQRPGHVSTRARIYFSLSYISFKKLRRGSVKSPVGVAVHRRWKYRPAGGVHFSRWHTRRYNVIRTGIFCEKKRKILIINERVQSVQIITRSNDSVKKWWFFFKKKKLNIIIRLTRMIV